MMNTYKTLDASAYLDLAQVAAGLRRNGAHHIAQVLTTSAGCSEHVVRAVITGTHSNAERIVRQVTDDADKRGVRLLGRLDEDRRGLDSHEHVVVFYRAVDPAV
jgi:hypothetical protein